MQQDAATKIAEFCWILYSSLKSQDIYNCNETGLYWILVSDWSLLTYLIPGWKKE